MTAPPTRERLVLTAAALLTAVIFAIDLLTPADTIPAMLYVLVILLGLWSSTPGYAVVAAGLTTILVIVDLGVTWSTPPPSAVYFNWPVLSLILWVTAVFVVRFKRVEIDAAAGVKQLGDIKYALDQAAIVATTDVTGRITYVNDKFCQISKFSREELIGQDHRIVNSAYHPKPFMRELWRTIADGEVWHGEIRNRARDGEFYWVDTTIVPFVNEQGKPYQYIAIRSDITQRKAAEARLRDQAALARVGQMAAVVAHEVKNPLAGIKGVIQVMLSRRPATDPEAQVMHDIVSRIDSLNELIQDLLLFSRPRPLRRKAVDVRCLLEEALGQVRKDPVGAGVTTDLTGDSLTVDGDADLLKATFLNLFLNAAQAMGGQGAIRVDLGAVDGRCTIGITDTGPGIPADIRDKVFEPFFTTKSRGGGLGLAIARRTLELHGGGLDLECPPGGGTTMRATIPIEAASAADPFTVG